MEVLLVSFCGVEVGFFFGPSVVLVVGGCGVECILRVVLIIVYFFFIIKVVVAESDMLLRFPGVVLLIITLPFDKTILPI